MKNILIVTGSNYTDQVYTAFTKVKNLGHKLYLLSDGSFEPKNGIFISHFKYDLRKTKEVLDYMKSQDVNFDAISIKTSEWLTPLVALLCRQYGCIGNEPIVAFNCRSKYHMRLKMKEGGLPIPMFKLCKNYDEILSGIDEIGIPCVLKPVGGNASYGTFMIQDKGDLTDLKNKYESSIQYLKEKSLSEDMFSFTKEDMDMIGVDIHVDMISDYLVEQYMHGDFQVSIDAITQDGRTTVFGIAEQIRSKPPYFVQLSEKMPFEADKELIKEIKDLAKRTITALGIRNSASHTEIIGTRNGLKVIEIACRVGGDNIHDSIYQTTGYNLMFEIVMTALGLKKKYKFQNKCFTAMQYLLPEKKGTIKKISVPKGFKNKYNITELQIDYKVGDKVDIPPMCFDFIGYACTKGEHPEVAEILLNRAMKEIDIEIN